MMLSSRLLTRQTLRQAARRFSTRSVTAPTSHRTAFTIATLTAVGCAAYTLQNDTQITHCSAPAPLGGEAVMLSPKTEEATGILFPRLCNGMTLAGCGVRVKWGFVKVRDTTQYGAAASIVVVERVMLLRLCVLNFYDFFRQS